MKLALALLLAMVTGAVAQERLRCYTSPDPSLGYPWAWRGVDGKTCWYRGPRKYDKNFLYWPAAAGGAESAARAAVTDSPATDAEPPTTAPEPATNIPENIPTPTPEPEPLQSYSPEDQKLLESYWPDLPILLAERSPTHREMFEQPPPRSSSWRDNDIIMVLVLVLLVISGLVFGLEMLKTKLDMQRTQ